MRALVLICCLFGLVSARADNGYVGKLEELEKAPGKDALFEALFRFEPFERLPHSAAQQDIAATMEWLKGRALDPQRSVRYAYAYAGWLWRNGVRDTAAMLYFYAGFKARWDGSRCADTTSPSLRIRIFENVMAPAIVPYVRDLELARREEVLKIIRPELEQRFAANPPDEWLCNGGMEFYREYFARHPEEEGKVAGLGGNIVRHSPVHDPQIKPRYVSEAVWRERCMQMSRHFHRSLDKLRNLDVSDEEENQTPAAPPR